MSNGTKIIQRTNNIFTLEELFSDLMTFTPLSDEIGNVEHPKTLKSKRSFSWYVA